MKHRGSRWVKRERQGGVHTSSCGTDSNMSTIVSSCSLASAEFRFPGATKTLMAFYHRRHQMDIGGEKFHCSTRARRSWSATTDCTGRRTLLKLNKPILTLMYSGSPLSFKKILSVRPILCPWGSHTVYPAYSSAVLIEPPRSLEPNAVYSLCIGDSLSSSLLPRCERCSLRRSLAED